jgi:hypothetical protein
MLRYREVYSNFQHVLLGIHKWVSADSVKSDQTNRRQQLRTRDSTTTRAMLLSRCCDTVKTPKGLELKVTAKYLCSTLP